MYKFIINPRAGKGKYKQDQLHQITKEITRIARRNHIDHEIDISNYPGEAIQLSRQAAQKGFQIIVAVGGDGTVNEVANGMAESNAVLAALPCGKGNDFANILSMPNQLEKAIHALFQGKIKLIDLGKALNRYFVNTAGVGFDAQVASRINQQGTPFFKQSKWSYIYGVFATFLTYHPLPMEIFLDGTAGDIHLQCSPMMVAVGIGRSCGGGIKVLPTSIQDDGYFDVCVIDKMNKGNFLYYLPQVIAGKHVNLNQCYFYRARKVNLKATQPLTLHMEGEIFTEKEICFDLFHQKLKVLQAPMGLNY